RDFSRGCCCGCCWTDTHLERVRSPGSLMDEAQTLASREPLAAGTLQSAVERAMARELGRRERIRSIERRPSEYSSSFAIEELDICTAGGERLELMFKDLS